MRSPKRVTHEGVCILEWPYREEELGPLLAYRLRLEELTLSVDQAGVTHLENTTPNQLKVYRLAI